MRSWISWSVWAGFLAASGLARGDEPARRPDIVLFLADDLGWADCSMFGGRDVPTPNMERLAQAGMTFRRAFVASPSCAPSRAAPLTGLDPIRNGAMLNHARPRPEIQTWPAYFHDLGYEVAAIGKTAHDAQVTTSGFDHASLNRYPIRAVRTRDRKYIRNLDPAAEHTTHVDRGNAGADGRAYCDSWVERAKTDPVAAAIVARYHHRPAEELYDLTADPLEQHNLAADPAHAATLAALRAEVDAWMKRQGDEGMATERALRQPRAAAEPAR